MHPPFHAAVLEHWHVCFLKSQVVQQNPQNHTLRTCLFVKSQAEPSREIDTQHMEFGLALLASKIETVTTHKVEQANTRRQTPAPPL
jgi:hypothetical protein